MNKIRVFLFGAIAIYFLFFFWACSSTQYNNIVIKREESLIFPQGEKLANKHFTGDVWLTYLVPSDSIYKVVVGSVKFEPGSRTHWHYHKGGQILLVIEGEGWYQEKGKPIETIQKGDVIKCPPNTEHWHGASKSKSMTHIAIGTNTDWGGAIWGRPVSDKEYNVVNSK